MSPINLYFIAILLPDEVAAEINTFKRDFAERFHCRAALKVVPHITLKAPFHLLPAHHEKLVDWFKQLQLPQSPFSVELEHFQVFRKANPVVFVQPILSLPLDALQQQVIDCFHQHFPEIPIDKHEQNFHPHITIAYRDLSPSHFTEAWKEYSTKQYNGSFVVNRISLLQHNGSNWEEVTSSHPK